MPQRQATVTIPGSNPAAIALMTRRYQGATYVFAVGMTDQKITARITLPGVSGDAAVDDEKRRLPISDGSWSDTFNGYEAHLYIASDPPAKP